MTAAFTPTHHPDCTMLYRYAAGRLSPGMRFLTEAHLAFCPRCRYELQAYEAEAGLGLENLPPEEMDTHCLRNLMSKIDEHGPPACIDVTLPSRDAPDPRYPENLRIFTGARGEKIVWREASGGREWEVPFKGVSIRLLSLEPGQRITRALLGASEILVLDGEIAVASHRFHGGDVIRTNILFHPRLSVRSTVLCLCVKTAKEDRPGFFGRLMDWIRGKR